MTSSRVAKAWMHHIYDNILQTAVDNTTGDSTTLGIVWRFYSSPDDAPRFGGFIRHFDGGGVYLLDRMTDKTGLEAFDLPGVPYGTLHCDTSLMTGHLSCPGVSTTDRDGLKVANATVVYNSSDAKMQFGVDDVWHDLDDINGDTGNLNANLTHTFVASAGSYSVQRNITRIVDDLADTGHVTMVSLQVTKTGLAGTLTVTYPPSIQLGTAVTLTGFVDTTPCACVIAAALGATSFVTPSMTVGQIFRLVAFF